MYLFIICACTLYTIHCTVYACKHAYIHCTPELKLSTLLYYTIKWRYHCNLSDRNNNTDTHRSRDVPPSVRRLINMHKEKLNTMFLWRMYEQSNYTA